MTDEAEAAELGVVFALDFEEALRRLVGHCRARSCRHAAAAAENRRRHFFS